MLDADVERATAAHRLAGQIRPFRIDVEVLLDDGEHVHHVEFAQLAEIRRIRRSGRLAAPSCPRRRLRDAVPARAVPAVQVHAHRRDDDVAALFGEFRQIGGSNELLWRALQAVQQDDQRRRFRPVVPRRHEQLVLGRCAEFLEVVGLDLNAVVRRRVRQMLQHEQGTLHFFGRGRLRPDRCGAQNGRTHRTLTATRALRIMISSLRIPFASDEPP